MGKSLSVKTVHVILALIIGVSILTHGVLSFISSQKKLSIEKQRIDADMIIWKNNHDKESKLEKCLSDAKAEFNRAFKLNSTAGKTPGGDEARLWNNHEISLQTKETFNKDREFCLNLFK